MYGQAAGLLRWENGVRVHPRNRSFRVGFIGDGARGKAISLQPWKGPEVSSRLRLPDLKTTAQDGGKPVSLTHRPSLHPGNKPGTHFC
jgi:hypothetical protein